jgi:hypothetical protein
MRFAARLFQWVHGCYDSPPVNALRTPTTPCSESTLLAFVHLLAYDSSSGVLERWKDGTGGNEENGYGEAIWDQCRFAAR